MSLLQRAIVPFIIVALVVAGAIVMFTGDGGDKTLTAYFPRTVSLYEGSDVRVLGVAVGKIESVTPEGTRVKVVVKYDGDIKVPADAQAVIISPSIVGDRYVQLTPVYDGGAVLADNVTLEEDQTAVPLELDQIYSSLDRLTVALGPNGANANGALTDLLETTAANFGGQGAKFRQTLADFSTLSETLDDNKEELFGSLTELEGFVSTLADNDDTVRRFNQSLADVSTMLAGESDELSAALGNLSTALGQVGTFVEENKASLGRNITGLNRVAKILVKRRSELDQILRIAPVALTNLALAYNPDSGTLDTNANLGNLAHELQSDPGRLLCALVSANDDRGTICNLIQGLLPAPGAHRAAFGDAGKQGQKPVYQSKFDLSLNGLVTVQ
jgi:phospholipid/cholesterol/gamma-HCH transport system substrate-binding protein